jgi:hypothetical protein
MRDDEECKKLYSATLLIGLAAIISANFTAHLPHGELVEPRTLHQTPSITAASQAAVMALA